MEKKAYQKGQKINVPREIKPYIEELISRREEYEQQAFRQVGEAFGYGAKDINPEQEWMFSYNSSEGVAYAFLKEDEDKTPIAEAPLKDLMASVAKLEIAATCNPTIVAIIQQLVPDMQGYIWTLNPAEMEIEIIDVRPKPEINLADVANQGGVQ